MRFHSPLVASLTALVAISSASWGAEKEDKDKGENEQKIEASQLPAAVKATIDQQVAGAAVIAYEKETRDGKTVYTAEVTGKEKGQVIEYVVGEDGKLIATDVETGAAESGKGENEGKKKHHKKDKDATKDAK